MLRLHLTSACQNLRNRVQLLGGSLGVVEARMPCARTLELPEGPLVPLQVRWAKKSKRKKAPKAGDRTPEMKAISPGSDHGRRLEDLMYNPESPYQMTMQIKTHLHGLTADGRHNKRRKKDLNRYTHYRALRIAGLTHDAPKENEDRRGFVTPLTELQDNANLPRSPLHRRFNFPHMLSYKVYWGPPSVEEQPNAYEGSMVGCTVAVRLQDLPLTARQRQRLVEIVGPDMVDEETGVLALEADNFTERNQNAALLGDMLEKLLREAIAADAKPLERLEKMQDARDEERY